jgi:hypothetical protein
LAKLQLIDRRCWGVPGQRPSSRVIARCRWNRRWTLWCSSNRRWRRRYRGRWRWNFCRWWSRG